MNIGLVLVFLTLCCFLFYFIVKNGKPAYYLLFIIYSLPLLDLKVIPFDYGNLKVFDAITILALLISNKDFFKKFNLLDTNLILFGLLITMLLLSSVASEFGKRALLSLAGVVTPFIFCRFLLIEVDKDPSLIIRVFRAMKFTSLVALAFVVMQLILGPERFTFYDRLNQNVIGGDTVRYPGFFMDAQINGVFFAMISFVWLFNFEHIQKFSSKQLALFTILLGGLLLSGSRSPMLGVAAGMSFLILFLHGNFRFQIFRYALLGGIVVILASATTDTFKRFNDMDDSISFRQNIWDGALDIFKSHPLLGIGTNNYKDYAMKHAQNQSILLENDEVLYLDFPENGYLKLLVEWGAIAFALLAVILLLPLFRMAGNYLRGDKSVVSVLLGAIGVCWFISNISVYTLSDTRIIVLLCVALTMLTFFNRKKIIFE